MHRVGGAPADAWGAALRAVAWLASPEHGVLPTLDAVEAHDSGDVDTAEAAGICCAVAERAALLAFSPLNLRAWLELHERLQPSPSSQSGLWLSIGRGWLAIMDGAVDSVDEAAGEVRRIAASQRLPVLSIEATALRAMAAAASGDEQSATKLARRASRMARTESLPQQEYLVNLILARVRRTGGQPYLASRILNALVAYASAPWRGWVTWELILAQGATRTELAPMLPGPARTATAGLHALALAAQDGDQPAYDAASAAARNGTAGFAALRGELERLLAIVDPRTDLSGLPAEWTWCRGEGGLPPLGLHGVCGLDSRVGGLHRETAYVLTVPEREGRRLLAISRGLMGPSTVVLDTEKRPQIRTDSAIAVLLLAGSAGLSEDDLFLRLYGFPFDAALHRAVRNTLYTRVRARLGDVGCLDRADGQARLVPLAAFAAPDPRASPPAEHTLLSVLAKAKHMSARDAAAALGMPLRTVQLALAELAEDGACQVVAQGRGHVYVLEDTTFSEPSQHLVV